MRNNMPKTPDYTQVRVYKTAKTLLITATELTKNFNREYRFTIGQDFYKSIIDFIVMIYDAYIISDFKNQYEYISKLKRQLQYVNVYIRLSCGLHLISKERYMELTKLTQDADNQLTGWLYSIQKKLKGTINTDEHA